MSEPRLVNGRFAIGGQPVPGGTSDVYQANDMQRNGSLVALKLFHADSGQTGVLAEVYNRELRSLRELQHPNIVRLLDLGRDEATNRQFLVLEWMPSDLGAWSQANFLGGWDDYWDKIGNPLLDALAFAHKRHLAHRDVKPSNVLMSSSGAPKLADFGISKLKKYLSPGVTLAEFVSRPYCPPEYDDGSYTYTRDVFGFAALTLSVLTDVELSTYEDVFRALEELDCPEAIAEVMGQALSDDPNRRQVNAAVMLSQIRAIQQERSSHWIKKSVCHLKLTKFAIERLPQELAGMTNQSVIKTLEDDFDNACALGYWFPPGEEGLVTDETGVNLYGVRFQASCKIDSSDYAQLAVIRLARRSTEELEKKREAAWVPEISFSFSAMSNVEKGQSVIEAIRAGLDDLERLREEARVLDAETRLFRVWSDTLAAKTELERERETPIRYRDLRVQGPRITFYVDDQVPEEVVGQIRRVEMVTGGWAYGEIESIRDDSLVFYLDRGSAEDIPSSGRVLFDTTAAQSAIKKQQTALDAIRLNQAARQDLGSILLTPGVASPPEPPDDVRFIESALDEDKQLAVKAALGTSDILVVEGPPGTGKTTFIGELVAQRLAKRGSSRILLASQTHVALDNAIERIREVSPEARIVRLAGFDDTKIAASTRALLLKHQLGPWAETALLHGQEYLRDWADQRGIDPQHVTVGIELKELVALNNEIARQEQLAGELESVIIAGLEEAGSTTGPTEEEIGELTGELSGQKEALCRLQTSRWNLIQSITRLDQQALAIVGSDEPTIDAWLNDRIGANEHYESYEKLVKVFGEWQLRVGKGPEFEAAMLASADVVAGTCIGIMGVRYLQYIDFDLCIVDEASKAAPTELLVPMHVSKRWVLVGDRNQLPPFQGEIQHRKDLLSRFNLSPADVKESLFARLSDSLPAGCRVALRIQHRMVPPIGRLISECFYDGQLVHAGKDLDPVVGKVMGTPVLWVNTSLLGERQESRQGIGSYINSTEVQNIVRLLEKFETAATEAGRIMSVAVLTGYSAQRSLLERRIDAHRAAMEHLRIEVNTVDAFQGREADIVVFSVTRSNSEKNLGFVKDKERMNVALSRGRYGLAIVGDRDFCVSVNESESIRSVIRHMLNFPSECSFVGGE